MFGKGKVTTHPKEAQAFMTEAQKDPAVITARFRAALEQLKQDPHVDGEQIAAIGYCFGVRWCWIRRVRAPIWMGW